jgi:hypothetical protein
VRVGRPSTAVGAPSSYARAPRYAPAAVGQAGAPRPSDELAQEALARRIDGGGWLGGGGSVLGQIRTGQGTIYRGSRTEL